MNSGGLNKELALEEVAEVYLDCTDLIKKIKVEYLNISRLNTELSALIRLSSIGVFYSCWERMFRLSCGIGISYVMRNDMVNISECRIKRSLFISKESFCDSFFDIVKGKNKVKGQLLSALEIFLIESNQYSAKSCKLKSASDYVNTFSNVDLSVLDLNAEYLGFMSLSSYKKIRRGNLNELVGLRNDLSHGGSLKGPEDRKFLEILEFTLNLLEDFYNCIKEWIGHLSADLVKLKRKEKRRKFLMKVKKIRENKIFYR